MPAAPRHLRKPDVEALLTAVSGPADSALEEITVVRHGLAPALARVLGLDPSAPWAELVAAAADQAAWPPARTALVTAAAAPDAHPDPEAVLDALWDLVRELNELRRLDAAS